MFYSIAYSQSDEIKLWNQNEPLYGKVIVIKSSTVEFKEDSTGFSYEFNKEEVNYIKASNGDTVWFKRYADEINNSKNNDIAINAQNISDNNKKITLFFSYNFSGTHESSLDSASGSLDVNAAMSLGFEVDIIKTAEERVKLGLGAMYQFPRQQENVDGDFNFIPFYAFIKLDLLSDEKIKLYVIPTIGYNLFNGDSKYSGDLELNGGIYNSVGLGLIVRNNLDIKLLYQFNRGSVYFDTIDKEAKIVYKSFGLHCGYYF